MAVHVDTSPGTYVWEPQPEPTQFLQKFLASFLASCPAAVSLASRLREETGTRLWDLIDHVALPGNTVNDEQLGQLGFVRSPTGDHAWVHPQGMFPTIIADGRSRAKVALAVESVADFLAAHGMEDVAIAGEPFASLRKAKVDGSPVAELWVVERHGWRGFDSRSLSTHELHALAHHAEAFRRRARHFQHAEHGFAHAQELVSRAVDDLGVDRACDLFFSAERQYWQRRNRGGQVQKARQDRLGLGWANHDHHTYRSSRRYFSRLISVFEQLGCECRERFYGGRDAGWGAQVLEQAAAGIVIFADVDLTPEEVTGDFAHLPMPARDQLGTVGLWCELHGEAFLEAGMHHLECRFDFDVVREQLKRDGIETMQPFTDFSYLRQAFTKADLWPVAPHRIESAAEKGYISGEQAERFAAEGVLGSHLEILERNDGYKGFNQTGINQIIRQTDPRRQS
jgi:hypothetical protein